MMLNGSLSVVGQSWSAKQIDSKIYPQMMMMVQMVLISLLQHEAELEEEPILWDNDINIQICINILKNHWWTFHKLTSLFHYLILSVSWQQHIGLCCLVDNLLAKMTMIYGITWLIKFCLKLKLLCKLSVPFGNQPRQDKNKKTEGEKYTV